MNSNPLEFDIWYKDKYDKKVLSGRYGSSYPVNSSISVPKTDTQNSC